nr:MAG TPA: hypothetical protein [Caudoviricetes sp.]
MAPCLFLLPHRSTNSGNAQEQIENIVGACD